MEEAYADEIGGRGGGGENNKVDADDDDGMMMMSLLSSVFFFSGLHWPTCMAVTFLYYNCPSYRRTQSYNTFF
jgi:hypothetical protein